MKSFKFTYKYKNRKNICEVHIDDELIIVHAFDNEQLIVFCPVYNNGIFTEAHIYNSYAGSSTRVTKVFGNLDNMIKNFVNVFDNSYASQVIKIINDEYEQFSYGP